MTEPMTDSSPPDGRAPDRMIAGARRFAVPSFSNAVIVIAQLFAVATCFLLLRHADSWRSLLPLALVFGVIMNSVYSSIHEAHHRILFENRRLNDGTGILLALLFPAPFHLLRQGHIGHHRSNRSDDEVFDLYFDRDSRVWKYLAWYGILTGLYWVLVALSNVILLVVPRLMDPQFYRWDRTSEVFLGHFDRKTFPLMRLEALAAIALHTGIIFFFAIPPERYLAMYFGFGWMWSSLQYVHHYGTERHVLHGAKNLHLFRFIDWIWMNHNWHHTHHLQPTVPWRYLPELADQQGTESEPLVPAYIKMWRGPQYATEHVRNRFDGEVSRS